MIPEPCDIRAIVDALRGMIEERDPAVAAPILAKWPSSYATVTRPSARPLPVTDYLPQLADGAPPFSADLVGRLARLRHQLDWQQTYSADDLGQAFLDRYGWTLFAGPEAVMACDGLLIGVLLLGPDVEYPAHQHSAEEVYLPLVGTASWRIGEDDWRAVAPGTLIHNPPWQWHGMRTDQGEALLAAVVWNASAVEKSNLMKGTG